MTLSPPIAKKVAHTWTHKGDARQDPFAWMRAENWQEVMQDPSALAQDIRENLEAENAYTKQVMQPFEPLIDTLQNEMIGRIKQDDQSPPSPHGDFEYSSRFVEGAQHRQFWRQLKGKPETAVLLFDADLASKESDFYNMGGMGVSPNHKLLAIAEDRQGNEAYTIKILDLDTGLWLADQIDNTSGDFSWIETNGGLLYTTLDDSHRSSKLWRHIFGRSQDELVYEETDGAWQIGIGKCCSRKYHILSRGTSGANTQFLMDAHNEAAQPRLVADAEEDFQYDVGEHEGKFYIWTNADGATDFKICVSTSPFPTRDTWRDFIPHKPGRMIGGMDLFSGHMVLDLSEKALPSILVRDMATGEEHTIDQTEPAFALGHAGSREYDTDVTRYAYNSPTTPSQIFDYNMRTREKTMVYEQEVPSGHSASDYVTERFFITSHDGVEVPVTILRKADTPVDGSAPLFVYGYGSYGIPMGASFNTNRLSLVDRGMIYATAHIRGGSDMGRSWYLDGKLDKKLNTFKDFIAVTEALCERGYGTKGQVASMGGSAGGMLMGGIMNMRPDLFKAIVASVPFVDVLSTILDDSLPLTPGEWTEWGNPITDEAAYELIKSYSPYDNVSKQAYPNTFVTAGISDPRVTYWEPQKWVAKLREHKTDDNVLIFKTNVTAGHFGVSGRFDALREVAEEYAFILWSFGIEA